MSARWTENDLAEYQSRKPRNSTVRESAASPTREVDASRPKKRDRFAEQAGELGQKIFAHREQLKGQIRLWLPYPPTTNSRMANIGGRMIKSAEARSYQKVVKEALVGIEPLTGDLEVSLTINRPRRRGDMDNVLKNIFDALSGIAFVDDEQIAMIEAKRYDGERPRANPGVHIQINQIGLSGRSTNGKRAALNA